MLLTPTKIYSRLLLPILRSGVVKAYAHITGGGLLENIPRVLPQGLAVDLGEEHTLVCGLRWFSFTTTELSSTIDIFTVCVFLCSDASRWNIPPVFSWLHKEGGLSQEEMGRTFNCGLGAVLVVSPPDAQRVLRQLQAQEEAWIVGSLSHKQPGETRNTAGSHAPDLQHFQQHSAITRAQPLWED